jgi:hypothetical protein
MSLNEKGFVDGYAVLTRYTRACPPYPSLLAEKQGREKRDCEEEGEGEGARNVNLISHYALLYTTDLNKQRGEGEGGQ